MRVHAYLVRSERFLKVETAILAGLDRRTREEMLELLGTGYTKLELMSGEWRALFEQTGVYDPVINGRLRMARMIVAPDRLAKLVNVLWHQEIHDLWLPIAHGLTNLTYALPLASGLIGVVFLEEPEDWLQTEPAYEMIALRPDVYRLLAHHVRQLIDEGDFTALSRLVSDHADSQVEFTAARWLAFRETCAVKAPELLALVDSHVASPEQYNVVTQGIRRMLNPQEQPSLDSWFRVHFGTHPQAVVFRDIRNERHAARSALPTLVHAVVK